MKILMVSSYLPYPLYSGGQVRLYNLIKELAKKHEITLVCEIRPHQSDQDIREVSKICHEVITVPRKKQWSAQNILKSGLSAQSFLVTGHTIPLMRQKIVEVLSRQAFDLIHVETFYVLQNVPATSLPVVLVEHNIEYKVYEKFQSRVPLLFRPLLGLDITKIRREEETAWKQTNTLVAVSKDDQIIMEKRGLRPSIVPNGVNTEYFTMKKKQSSGDKKVLFIGDFSWIQNRDSAMFIIKEIWPIIKAKGKDESLKLWLVGRDIPKSIKNLTQDRDVLFDEKSSGRPTNELFQEASVLLAPIRVGGGTSYKILESMSSGTPVITMQMSADAIHATDRENIMVGDTAEVLAAKTVQLLEDPTEYERIAHAGRKLIENRYTWKIIADRLDKIYQETL